jgi:hypothetical protein
VSLSSIFMSFSPDALVNTHIRQKVLGWQQPQP